MSASQDEHDDGVELGADERSSAIVSFISTLATNVDVTSVNVCAL